MSFYEKGRSKDNSSGDDSRLLLTPFPSQSKECRQDPSSVL
jgi:hypothetical protein